MAVYGPGVQTAVAYAMNTEFGHVLANEMVMSEMIIEYLETLFSHLTFSFVRSIIANPKILIDCLKFMAS